MLYVCCLNYLMPYYNSSNVSTLSYLFSLHSCVIQFSIRREKNVVVDSGVILILLQSSLPM